MYLNNEFRLSSESANIVTICSLKKCKSLYVREILFQFYLHGVNIIAEFLQSRR